MKKFLFPLASIFCLAAVAFGQPRPVDRSATQTQNIPDAFPAQYEGGIFGNSRKEAGSLKLDDANNRVVFFDKDQKEMFSMSYEALLVIYPDSKEGVTKTGNVVSKMPLPGAGLAGLITKSTKYLIIKYDDPDVDAQGTANFKFDDREKLMLFIDTLGKKAKMLQRGEAYYRAKKPVF